MLGAWRFASVSPAGDPQAISALIGSGKVEVRGTVADEPKFLDRSILLLVAVSSTSTNHGSSWRDTHGQIEVQLPGAPTALRAGIMGTLLAVVPRFGRTYNIYTALALAALLMSLLDPFVMGFCGVDRGHTK